MGISLYGPLVRQENDQHVLISNSTTAAFAQLLSGAQSHAELLSLYLRLDPWAQIIDTPPAFPGNATSRLHAYVTDENVAPYINDGLDRFTAIGAYVRSGDVPEGDRLAFLSQVPPENVHSMQRGENWIGDFYSADLIMNALHQCGVVVGFCWKVLDYGCSSGALLRALSWACPSSSFVGTDPVANSIDWASSNLIAKNLLFLHQTQEPPLPIESESINLVTAVSIFSHHGINASKQWFDEIARITKTGGYCVFTAHGSGALAYYIGREMHSLDRYRELCANFLAHGFVFQEPWMGEDEVGNVATDAEWGDSFYSPPTMISTFSAHFDLVHLAKRANQGNQDLYVIRKR
jgi:SAM-dependent methyltransferase